MKSMTTICCCKRFVGEAGRLRYIIRGAEQSALVCTKGFSLVEVVLALGIVAFCLLAMFSLLGNSLKTSSDTMGTTEALNARETVNEFLRTRWSGGNFTTAYDDLKSGTLGDAYVFALTNDQGVAESKVYSANDSGLTDDVGKRSGRLLRATFKVSPNFQILGANKTLGNFTAADLPATAAAYSNAALGVVVDVYDVPGVDSPNYTNNHVLRYETTISR